MSVCRSCNATIIFLKNDKTGRPMPIDPEPDQSGNVVITGNLFRVLNETDKAEAIRLDVPIHTSHFQTCTHSKDWRGGHR
jgi:hypothetical protein